jgi:amidohydrolase
MNPRPACTMFRWLSLGWLGGSLLAQPAGREAVQSAFKKEHASLTELYLHWHRNPELSWAELETAKRFAAELTAAGCEVHTGIGTNGVVGLLRNGAGPTVLVRTDLDALPVREETGRPYASTVRTRDTTGREVSVMHACGHDMHMTVIVGVARMLAATTNLWRGTIQFIGQPAEELGSGAAAMVREGLYQRFGVPQWGLALHCNPMGQAGTVAAVEGFTFANVDTVEIRMRGVGGHGAYPHLTKDPVVLAAQSILALQTIASRETNPRDAVVVTVGSIHGGTKSNIIPDDVLLQLTVRSYTDAVRDQTLTAIRRIVEGQALAAGVPTNRLPEVRLVEGFTPALYNDPPLTRRLLDAMRPWLGPDGIRPIDPTMGGEDFSEFGRTAEKVPLFDFWLGTVSAERIAAAEKAGTALPGLHSSKFSPDIDPTLETGVTAMTAAVLELLPPGR